MNDRHSPSPAQRAEGGFTLIEILVAMGVLSIGVVAILSLFAAAVGMQYDSVVSSERAAIVEEVATKAQETLNAYSGTKDHALPPPIAKQKAPLYPRTFDYTVQFIQAADFPTDEGAIARITLFYRGRPLTPVSRVLQKTGFSKQDLEHSITYEQDQKADEAAKQSGQDLKNQRSGQK